MENTQKIVIVLLIVAIIFSVMSIIISMSISNIDLSKFSKPNVNRNIIIKENTQGVGSVGLIIESPPK